MRTLLVLLGLVFVGCSLHTNPDTVAPCLEACAKLVAEHQPACVQGCQDRQTQHLCVLGCDNLIDPSECVKACLAPPKQECPVCAPCPGCPVCKLDNFQNEF